MPRVSFNHVGLCVRDLARSRRFYEELLEFRYWWTYKPGDDSLGPGLGIKPPIGMTSLFFFKDGIALELLHFAAASAHAEPHPHAAVAPARALELLRDADASAGHLLLVQEVRLWLRPLEAVPQERRAR